MNISELKKVKWYKQGAAGWLLATSMPYFAAHERMRKVSEFPFPESVYFTIVGSNGTIFAHFIDADKNRLQAISIMKKMESDPAYFRRLAGVFFKEGDNMEELGLKLVLSGIKGKNFKKDYAKFYEASMRFWENSLFLDVFDNEDERLMKTVFGNLYGKLSRDQLGLLVSPAELSNIQKELEDLLKIYTVAKKSGYSKRVKEFLEKHAQKFYWIKSDYETVHYLDYAYYKKKLDSWLKSSHHAQEVADSLRKSREVQRKKKLLISRLKIDAGVRKRMELLDLFTTMRDARKKYNNIGNYVLLTLGEQAAKVLKLDPRAVKMATVKEFPKLVGSPELAKELKKRLQYGTLAYVDAKGNVQYDTGVFVKKWLDEVEETLKSVEIRGTVACPGKAKGKVKIVLCQGDFKKMEKGDVLVANMTRPEYFPLMKLAAAIVTDEGGVTCHAAIVSRELGVPCVIGTQVATKSLKDGDMVEVDANRGIVKVLDDSLQEKQEKRWTASDSESFLKEDYQVEHLDSKWLFIDIPASIYSLPYNRDISCFSRCFAYQDGPELDWITPKSDIKKIYERVIEIDTRAPGYFAKIHAEWRRSKADLSKFYKDFLGSDLKRCSNELLSKKLKQLFDLYVHKVKIPPFVDAYMFSADKALDSLLVDFARKKKLSEQPSVLFSILSSPAEESFFNREENDLREIAMRKKKGLKVDVLISKHLTEYAYLKTSYVGFVPYLRVEVDKKINALVMKNDLKKKQPHLENLAKKKVLVRKYGFTKKILQLVKLTETLTAWQDERKEFTLMSIVLIDKVINEIHRRYGINLDTLKACSFKDLFEVLRTGSVPASVTKRLVLPTMAVYENGSIKVEINGEEAVRLLAHANGINEGSVSEIRGFVASTGRVKGRVKIVRSMKDAKKIREGDILVIPMTRPEHLPIMKKAGAIVTDDGGITCHAAIISRELKKPCIIGTKIATKVLKDGDLVEVDANRGIISLVS